MKSALSGKSLDRAECLWGITCVICVQVIEVGEHEDQEGLSMIDGDWVSTCYDSTLDCYQWPVYSVSISVGWHSQCGYEICG